MIFWSIFYSIIKSQDPKFSFFESCLYSSWLYSGKPRPYIWKTEEIIAINIYRKLKTANSLILKPNLGWSYFISMEKKEKVKPYYLFIFKFRNWQGNSLTSSISKDKSRFPVLSSFYPDLISVFKAKALNREDWLDKQYWELKSHIFFGFVMPEWRPRLQKRKTLKTALNHSICIGCIDLSKKIYIFCPQINISQESVPLDFV